MKPLRSTSSNKRRLHSNSRETFADVDYSLNSSQIQQAFQFSTRREDSDKLSTGYQEMMSGLNPSVLLKLSQKQKAKE